MAKKSFLKATAKMIMIILWLVAALAWNDVAKSLISQYATTPNLLLFFRVVYLLVVIGLVVLVAYFWGHFTQEKRVEKLG